MANALARSARSEVQSFRVFREILDLLQNKSPAELDLIAHNAGVAHTTVWSWITGRTKSPQIRTLTLVAFELGYEITLTKTKQPRRLRRVK